MFDAMVKNVLGHVHRGGYEFAVRGNIKRDGTVKIGTAYPWKKMTYLERAVLEKLLTGKADTLSGADREGTNVGA